MPPRISRSSISGGSSRPQQRGNKRRKQRSLNAFSIASEETQEKNHARRSRLGEIEDGEPRRKKQRLLEDDEGAGNAQISNGQNSRRSRAGKNHGDDPDVSEGSDSEGHEWRMGDVREDDDSDVDSDEAFGESDEERFEDFTFRGSTSKSDRSSKDRQHKPREVGNEIDLDEEEEAGIEEEDDDFGDEGIDLAQVLDDDEEDMSSAETTSGSDDENQRRSYKRDGGEDSDDDTATDNEVEAGSNDDLADRARLLQDLVASLPKENTDNADNDEDEVTAPSAQTLLKSLQAMPNLDPSLGQSVKTLTKDVAKSKDGQPTVAVKIPLPKRQQDKIDRAAAYEKAKETLNRWVDTVKHNRRAEHLTFPLPDPDAQEPRGESRMVPTADTKPRNDLEDAISSILKSSGFANAGSKSEENKLKAAEDLETNSLPLEEVLARRAELRKQRDLLFREEKRAKRIKKIKSKAYRRVHRKEKEREAQKERDLMAAAGVEIPEEEQEAIDRRRAEERMGARHKESRWAKGVKQTGRAAWDDDARSGVAEMARRSEQLKQRVAGNDSRNVDGSHDDSTDNDSSSSEGEGGFTLRDSLKRVQDGQNTTESTSRLGSLKFMQRADAARRQRNDEAVKQVLKDMNGTASESESDEDTRPGRQIFGHIPKETDKQAQLKPRLEFEEAEGSESEAEPERTQAVDTDPSKLTKGISAKPKAIDKTKSKDASQNPTTSPKKIDAGAVSHTRNGPSHNTSAVASLSNSKPVPGSNDSRFQETPEAAEEDPDSTSLLPSNLELVQAAFGGDEVEAEFVKEKQELMEDEDDKIIDNTLPGWGSWAGSGLSKRDKRAAAQKKASGRFATKQAGVKATDRKDARLGDRVIISEKQVKKNQKYLAPALPHPFESRQQYERSLRIPIGPEWTTKESFQSATKPRIMLKRGVVKPIQAPVL